jgi:NAD(P)-dependent dehydrogenase (short-subunit alcohol dehydrogenase family)
MQEQGGGVILNIVDSNPAALAAPGRAAYAASQQGFLALSQAAAQEFILYNIRVHTLCPDETLLYEENFRKAERPRGAAFPNGTSGTSPSSQSVLSGRTLSGLAIFLCGPEAAHLPGQVYRVGHISEEGEP